MTTGDPMTQPPPRPCPVGSRRRSRCRAPEAFRKPPRSVSWRSTFPAATTLRRPRTGRESCRKWWILPPMYDNFWGKTQFYMMKLLKLGCGSPVFSDKALVAGFLWNSKNCWDLWLNGGLQQMISTLSPSFVPGRFRRMEGWISIASWELMVSATEISSQTPKYGNFYPKRYHLLSYRRPWKQPNFWQTITTLPASMFIYWRAYPLVN